LVNAKHKAFQFLDEADLIAGLSSGLQKALRGDPLADAAVQRVIARLSFQATDKDQRIETLERENAALKQQLADAIAHTLQTAAQPAATAVERAAAAALESGDTRPAEALLRRNEEAAEQRAQAAPDEAAARIERRRAAQFARERGALAMQTDVAAALGAYRLATEYEPDDLWSWFFLGDLFIVNGSLVDAAAAYRSARKDAERRAEQPDAGDNALRDLSVSHNKIGDVLVAQGDGPGALAAYRKGLAIREALTARDPANTEWQRDLSTSYYKLGDWLLKSGERVEARKRFRASHAISERLAATDSTNVQWQLDVADQLVQLGRCAATATERIDCLQRGLAIVERVSASGRLPVDLDWIPKGTNWRDWFSQLLSAPAD
jgi:hypothetical protein